MNMKAVPGLSAEQLNFQWDSESGGIVLNEQIERKLDTYFTDLVGVFLDIHQSA